MTETARITITVPTDLKRKLEALGSFPYKSVSNAAVVLMSLGLKTLDSQPDTLAAQLTAAIATRQFSPQTLRELLSAIAEALEQHCLEAEQIRALAISQLAMVTKIPSDRVEAIRQGDAMSAAELKEMARAMKATPLEVKQLLGITCEGCTNGD